ncbi:MAG TPA: autotransporter-associated beta strand repeat-containing protein [Verrucomicrobiae bacterium]|nr:autotransporter-associated beta strand repeat-containing protein [Verrucomicrobiae bacterium]
MMKTASTSLTQNLKLKSLGAAILLGALSIFIQLSTSFAATHTWTGGGANEYWNNAANWSGGAPAAGEAAPVVLIFPGSVVTTNNIPGLTVDSLRFTGGNAVLHGSSGGTLTFRGAGGTNLLASGSFGTSNHLAATLPVTISGSNYFALGDSRTLGIHGVISGSGTVTYSGLGSQIHYGGTQANTATGWVRLMDGCWLNLAKPAGVNAIAGPVRVGNDGCRLMLRAHHQIANNVSITVADLGVFDLNGFDETIGNLTVNLADVQTGAGTLTLNGTIIPVSAGNTIWGQLSLGGVTRTINTTENDSLLIRANISNGSAAAGITKTGPGTLILWGTNTFSGPFTINGGTVDAYKDSALGSTAGGTVVSSNCTLRLMGLNIGAEALTLNGKLELYNTNTWAGLVTLGGTATIDLKGTGSQLTLSQSVGGSGSLKKSGVGTLLFSGAPANTFTGGLTVLGGNVNLNKAGVIAVPGPLQISTGMVKLLQANQIADASAVTVQTGAMLDLNNFADTIGSLAGNGSVNVGLSTLTTGGNNNSTIFGGVIYGVGVAPLVKNGSGVFTLNGTNACSGTTTVNGGSLVVNGELPGLIALNNSALLLGQGKVGNINSASGNVHPGLGIGKLTTSNVAMNSAVSSMNFEIAGTTPGTGHDQIIVNGAVTLNNVTLNVSSTAAGAIGNQYVIIVNDGADAVSGTFNGLPEGSTVTAGFQQYRISYQGGTGNDVVLTQIGVPPAPEITQIAKLPSGQIQITGSGIIGAACQVEATSNLSTPNWSVIGELPADWNGKINFTDVEANNHPQRFYRLKQP